MLYFKNQNNWRFWLHKLSLGGGGGAGGGGGGGGGGGRAEQ